jgi:hypothetical protein
MPLDIFLALFVFAFVMSFTPGPNNILLAASGVNFGFARTVPHMIGVTIGFAILILACSAGVGVVFAAVPGFSARAEDRGRGLYAVARFQGRDRAPERRGGARAGPPILVPPGGGVSMDQPQGRDRCLEARLRSMSSPATSTAISWSCWGC